MYFFSKTELINEFGFWTISSSQSFKDVQNQFAIGIPKPFFDRFTIFLGKYFLPRDFKRYLEVASLYFHFDGTEAINSTIR